MPVHSCIRGVEGEASKGDRKRATTEVKGKPGVGRVIGAKRRNCFKQMKAAWTLSEMRKEANWSTWDSL